MRTHAHEDINLSNGWRYMKEDPPEEGQHIVRRTICDMKAFYSSKKRMKWGLVTQSMQKGGSLKHVWKALPRYLMDIEERNKYGVNDEERTS